MSILVHYGELALKGKNRRSFENRLLENIIRAGGGRPKRLEGRFFIEDGAEDPLKNVFGISWFAPAYRVEKDLRAIIDLVIEKVEDRIEGNPTFGVYVKRVDKGFPYTSLEIANRVGEEVVRRYGLRVRLKGPDLPIYIEIADEAFIYFEKIEGLGGLPVGVSGSVLSLLSGGIDSPVSSYLVMKRGCRVDFIHFYAFSKNRGFPQDKIGDLVSVLNAYQLGSRVFLTPYEPFYMALLRMGSTHGYELILFRRFMLRVAERVAREWGYKALVTGDSLGQVASQTLENLGLVNEAVSLPVLQPLISFDKEEIIRLARKIGTYELSIRPYKDCCSIVAPHPKTKTRLERIKSLEGRMGIEKVINETLGLVEVYEI
ncbi:MAG TPA: tRNA uracil 4-sulfurtransferase ThiI [Thermodesulfobacteriota bacterium]|nr:tRNA uracil 4-sulfurtransferase ThiI [Thermodesulfobacteriota bacterium]